jgi:Zn-dependent protease
MSALAMLLEPLTLMVAFSVYINLVLMIINLVPVPPLDGGRVLVGLLPERAAAAMARLEPFGFFVVIILFFFSPLAERVLWPSVGFLTALLTGPQLVLVQKVFAILFRS